VEEQRGVVAAMTDAIGDDEADNLRPDKCHRCSSSPHHPLAGQRAASSSPSSPSLSL
jgi:hypothetical protein